MKTLRCVAKTDAGACGAPANKYALHWPRWPRIWRQTTGVGNGPCVLCPYHAQRFQRDGATITRKDGQKASVPKKLVPRPVRARRRLEDLSREELEERRKDIEARARAKETRS